MHKHDRKRRLPVVHRGKRIPNLYKRPKRKDDTSYGDTFELVYREDAGRQRQKTLKERTVQRVIEEAEEYRTQLRRGEVLPSSPTTVDQVSAGYFEVLDGLVKTGERSQRTADSYEGLYRNHVAPLLGPMRIQEVRPEHIASVYARQRRSGLAQWTISGTHKVVSVIFSFALSRGYIAATPLDRLSKLEKPKQQTQRKARRLTEAEVRLLCEKATPTYRPVITALAWTGLRVSEALGLRWQDIDFDGREIHVRHQLGPARSLTAPKTAAGKRTVPLLPVLEQELRQHRSNQLARGFAAPEQFVFTTAAGRPFSRDNVRNRGVGAAARKAGIVQDGKVAVTTHELRRTFISHLILGLGLDPVRVAKIAGHSNVSVTLNTYADEFDKAMHRGDLMQRIEKAGFGAV